MRISLTQDSLPLLHHALEYGQRGWPVIPVEGKRPLLKDWPNKASTDPRQLKNWWGGASPPTGIGILTGSSSGILALDIDTSKGKRGMESLETLESKYGKLPRTATVATGGGGLHKYFRYPEGLKIGNSAGLLGPGLDIRGEGGFIVAPPSIHAGGASYTWLDDTEIAEVPEALLQAITPRPSQSAPEILAPIPSLTSEITNAYGQAALKGEVESILHASVGNRNHTLNKAAFRLGGLIPKGVLTRVEIEDALFAAALQVGLGEREARATIASGLDDGIANPREVQPSERSRAKPSPPANEPELTIGINPISAKDLQGMAFPELRWAVPGLLPEGLIVLAGKPKMGKSWIALSLSISVAGGSMALGSLELQSRQGEVLYIGLEDSYRRLQDRLGVLLKGESAPERLMVQEQVPRMDQGGLLFVEEWLDQHPECRMVVIDTLGRFKPPGRPGKNAYEEDYEVMAMLQRLALKHRIALVVVTHLRKTPGEDIFDSVTGSTGITGAADATMVLERERNRDEGVLHITGRDIEERALALRFQDGAWTHLGEVEEYRLSKERQAVIDELKASHGAMKPKEIAEALGKKEGAIRKLLRSMAKDGQLLSDGGAYSIGNIGNFGNSSGRDNAKAAPRLPYKDDSESYLSVTELPHAPVYGNSREPSVYAVERGEVTGVTDIPALYPDHEGFEEGAV